MTGYSLEYVLDKLSIEQITMLYDYGLEFEETKSVILLNKYAELLTGKKSSKTRRRNIPDKPDIKKFNALYGNKIKRGKRKKRKLNGK